MNDLALARLAARVGRRLEHAGLRVATAESCTAGWIAKVLTDTAGSSRWLECGYVTYSDDSKHRALKVPRSTLARFGAVSRQTVRAMAKGALQGSRAQVAIAVSGIAGPDGATPDKPVGTVWLCLAVRRRRRTSFTVSLRQFRGNRDRVRRKSVEDALRLLARGIAVHRTASR